MELVRTTSVANISTLISQYFRGLSHRFGWVLNPPRVALEGVAPAQSSLYASRRDGSFRCASHEGSLGARLKELTTIWQRHHHRD